METRDPWNLWVEPFDLFISYSRKDNDAAMVSALVETIETDFAQFSPSVPLKVFFDKKSILDMQHWQDVLKKGLRQSKVMLAVLSEAYFSSEWCRREWEEYILVEQARSYPGEALTPIFIVAPEALSKLVPAAARDWWNDVTARNAVVEIHPYWPKGARPCKSGSWSSACTNSRPTSASGWSTAGCWPGCRATYAAAIRTSLAARRSWPGCATA